MNSIFQYNGNPVTFRNESGILMVNATEMAKPFGKRPVDWIQNQQTQEYMDELSKVRKSTLTDLVKVTRGGDNPGTWMHEDVAIEFARWLSPAFAIWCNDRIKELMQNGFTKLDNISRKDLAKMLLEAEEEKERVMEENRQKTLALKEAAPKVIFADAVTASETTILIGELAKILKQNGIEIGQKRLFEWLRDNGYLCKRGESWNQPTQYAMERGLFEIKKTAINPPDSPGFITVTTKVTPKGQVYFINKFLATA